jgi:tryptophan synthase alpha chain
MSLGRSIELAQRLDGDIKAPLVFMSYFNPILHMGIERFAKTASQAGITGVILPDVSFEESADIRVVFKAHSLGYIDLIAPTSSDERVGRIAEAADGFVYLVSVTGVTGVRSPESREIETFVGRVREKTGLPLYIGFGISSPEKARDTVRYGDGVIIGSALVRLIKQSGSSEEAVQRVTEFLTEVRTVIDQ